MSLEEEYLRERVNDQDFQIEDLRVQVKILRNQLDDCERRLKEYEELCLRHRLNPPLTGNPKVINMPLRPRN